MTAESVGYNLEKERVMEAFKKFKDLADRKKEISDRDIEALVNQGVVPIEDVYKLINFNVTTGNNIGSTATVKIEYNKVEKIERAIDIKPELRDYLIKAITSGTDALGEVRVKLSWEEKTVLGIGVSTDVIEASLLAYMNALNKLN